VVGAGGERSSGMANARDLGATIQVESPMEVIETIAERVASRIAERPSSGSRRPPPIWLAEIPNLRPGVGPPDPP
jgi:hypothetical protein